MKTLKNMLVTLAILIAVIFIADRAVKYLAGKDKEQTAKTETSAKAILQHPQAKVITAYTDSAGAHHIQIAANSNQAAKSALDDKSITANTMLDSAARAMKIKDQQLQELTRENLQLRAMVQLKPQGPASDSIYTYADKWLQLTYYIKSSQARLNYNVNISTGKFTPATWLPFIHKAAVLDLSADDPRATINNVEHVIITVPAPLIGFSAQAKAYYDIQSKTITPALVPDLRIGRFHVQDNLYYSQKVRQAVGVSWDILKINP